MRRSNVSMLSDSAILADIDGAFGAVTRPEHFTNFSHCEECAEHDELLRARTRESLSIEDVGNPGWDPLCFCSAEGFAYYFPALTRLALTAGYDWYANQLLFHLYSGYGDNRFFQYCTLAQRQVIAAFIGHLIETRASAIEATAASDDFLRCYELWSSGLMKTIGEP